jgi:hypothetical protein
MTSREELAAPGGLVVVAPAPVVALEHNYDTIFQYKLFPDAPARTKTYLGSKSPRRCRICHADNGTAPGSFRTDCHVMPEGFGNRELFTLEECDSCNANGGRLEDQLTKFLAPVRAILPLRSRKSGAKHKPADASYIAKQKTKSGGQVTRMEIHEEDPSIAVISRSDDELKVRIRKQSFNPMDVCRSIARMGLMAMPRDERDRLDYLVQWIEKKTAAPSLLTQFHIPGPGLRWSSLAVYRQKEPLIGQSPLVVAYSWGTAILVWHAPTPTMRVPGTPLMPSIGLSPYAPHVVESDTKLIDRDAAVGATEDVATIKFGTMRELTAHEAADADRWGL